MIYEKEKIRRIIEHKDNLINEQTKTDLEWIVEAYNEYFVNSKEYEEQKKTYKTIQNKYYNAEDEKETIKEEFIILKKKYNTLKETYNACCKNLKSMI